MFDCLIIGDSIAVGTHQQRRECVSYAKSGINTQQWNKQYSDKTLEAKIVIISLGTNDYRGIPTETELQATRARITSAQVYWILPPCNNKFCKPHVNTAVETIAKIYGDRIISTISLQADSVHPNSRGYHELAEKTKY